MHVFVIKECNQMRSQFIYNNLNNETTIYDTFFFFIDWESLWQRRPQITEDYNHF